MPADRLSGAEDLEPLIDLGEVPVGGIYWPGPQGTPIRAPLRLGRSRGSGLVQLLDRYDAALYGQYTFSGESSPSYRQHVLAVAAEFARGLPPTGRIVEIGASDGVLAGWFQEHGWNAGGIEPSGLLVQAAAARGVVIAQGYADLAWAQRETATHGPAVAVVLRHVLEHLDDPQAMFAAITALSDGRTRLLLELPSLEAMVAGSFFSNVFHEHVAYYDAAVLWRLLAQHGWGVAHYRPVEVHGGSHLLHCHRGPHRLPTPNLPAPDLGRFAAGFAAYRQALADLVSAELAAGRRLGIYGASHRTALLMHLAGLDGRPGAVACYDRNRLLHGRFLQPSGIPIRDPALMRADGIGTLVVCAIAYQDEIRREQQPFIAAGGRLVLAGGAQPQRVAA